MTLALNYNASQNTCTITNAISASTQAIKDLINSNTMQDLRDRNNELNTALVNSNQTAAIINQLRPYPQAAYLTVNPQASFGGWPYHAPKEHCC